MKICVVGLWHLGLVTSVCLAQKKHKVIATDFDKKLLKNVLEGQYKLIENDLQVNLDKYRKNNFIKIVKNINSFINSADYIWVNYDTPVNNKDIGDDSFIINKIIKVISLLKKKSNIIISSQLPIGSIKKIEKISKINHNFICIPENLKIGEGIKSFNNQTRIIVGIRKNFLKKKIQILLKDFTKEIVFMKIESAEMTKHALNAYLGLNITFANEIASLCDFYGASYSEVEKALKKERRISKYAYLSAGSSYSGGTIGRDINYLKKINNNFYKNLHVIQSITKSNNENKLWPLNKIKEKFNKFEGLKISLWGLTYKENSNVLRRSLALEISEKLLKHNVKLNAYDPLIKKLPNKIATKIKLYDKPIDTLIDSNIVIIFTNSNHIRNLKNKNFKKIFKKIYIYDQNNFLNTNNFSSNISYFTLGNN